MPSEGIGAVWVKETNLNRQMILSSCRLIYFLPLGGEVLLTGLTVESNNMQL